MAYIINTYNTEQLTIVEDGTIDQTTDLKLVGKNYAGYGEIQNENFVFLLENFAGANQPPKAISGQIWFNTSIRKLQFYDGSIWRTTGGAEVSPTAPAGLSEGDFWWDSVNEQLYAYNGTNYVLVGPQGVGDTITRFISRVIRDDQGINRPVIVSKVNDEIIHIISSIQFTIGIEDAAEYLGFDVVRKGITLKNTDSSRGGVTIGDMNTGFRFWGTATNADKLGGFEPNYYVSAENPVFTGVVSFADAGFTVGDSQDLVVKIVSYNKGLIANDQGDEIYLQCNTAVNSGIQKMALRITADAILPGYAQAIQSGINLVNPVGTAEVNIGSESHKFNTVHATSFNGLASSALSLRLGGIDRGGSTSATSNTVAVRDASGDIFANLFQGTATAARYADLAEKYMADSNYEPGTVVVFGGEAEVTQSTLLQDHKVAGVISTAPGFLLNNDLQDSNGYYSVELALKGRVPCKVIGKVEKGDLLITSAEPGVAVAASKQFLLNPVSICVIGKSLEDNDNESVKIVEIAV